MNRILVGDSRQTLPTLPAGCVQCCVTSPPYFRLRSYLPAGHPDKHLEIGSEQTPEEFLAVLLSVFREVRRVLRDDGLLFVNIGDSYAESGRSGGGARGEQWEECGARASTGKGTWQSLPRGYKSGDRLNMPERFALAMQAAGWIHRDTIIWHKASPMPSSQNGWRWERCRVKVNGHQRNVGWSNSTEGRPQSDSRHSGPYAGANWKPCPGCPKCLPNGGYVLRRGKFRTTTAHEPIYMFAKGERYFCDAEAVKEQAVGGAPGNKRPTKVDAESDSYQSRFAADKWRTMNAAVETRLPRSVWKISSEPLKAKHFACVDDETECLTAAGWKRRIDLRNGETIAQFDMAAGHLTWGPLLSVNAYPVQDEPVVVINSRDRRAVLSPNHRCVTVDRNGKRKFVEAKDLRPAHMFPIAADWSGGHSADGPGSAWAELIGWYVAEGHECRRSLNVELYQSKSDNPHFCERIEELLRLVEAEYEAAEYTRHYRGRETRQVTFRLMGFAAAKLRSLCPNKIIPANSLMWSDAECGAMLAGLFMGDANTRVDGRVTFSQKRTDIADMVHALTVRCGRPCSMSKKEKEGIWSLHVAQRRVRSFRSNGGSVFNTEPMTGVLWCPSTDLGTWVARREGRVFITGNSYPGELVRRCVAMATSSAGCCPQCGQCYAPIVETERVPTRPGCDSKIIGAMNPESPYIDHTAIGNRDAQRHIQRTKLLGYRATCTCNAGEPVPCTVLDPFLGSGRTGRVALSMGRDFIGCELNPDYVAIAEEEMARPWKPKSAAKPKRKKPQNQQRELFS